MLSLFKIEPPKLKENSQPIVHTKVGETLKLNCPILNFHPRGDYEWFVKGEGTWVSHFYLLLFFMYLQIIFLWGSEKNRQKICQ